MDLSLEAYRDIVKNVGNRADIATLCRVSKGFQYAAQRALYNTLYMRHTHTTVLLCRTLAEQPRLAELVDALTISLTDEDDLSDDDSDVAVFDDDNPPLLQEFWPAVASALKNTICLRYLNIHINNRAEAYLAWMFRDCNFRLRSFHCDLEWDRDLVSFLNTQVDLDDLYLIDYKDLDEDTPTTVSMASHSHSQLLSTSLPNLSTLECTFSEAAMALVPGRPITHLKSCFSRSDPDGKRAEISLLFSKLRRSKRHLKSLDIADSSYTEEFSIELLRHVVSINATTTDLRYLGTLVLPIDGRERLQFYGLLMRLPRIQSIEVEVSDWKPPPSSVPAFRALAMELRLYCPTVTRIVFVHDFDRTVVSVMNGICVIDSDISTDMLWSEA
ncbi:hypothetical protein HGRIS_005571 [Hohenbuehelia grisea]|uniref:F-box domain-containing protein n=1 Tax=Hohenbuehelia grisea TaxID=104357 RepID=A0ABR3JZ27_9AGAR